MTNIEQLIVDKYNSGKSPYEIAEELKPFNLNWYPVKIRRLLQKIGISLRDKSSGQKKSLETGRAKHPTKGIKLSQAKKDHLSKAIAQAYADASPEEKERRAAVSKANYGKLTPEQKKDLSEAAIKAILFSSKNGSKVERFLVEELNKRGYFAQLHPVGFLEYNPKLQVDIYVPSLKVCIEVDGISHVEPVWSEEALARTKETDSLKNGSVINNGFIMIRLQAHAQKISKSYLNKTLARLLKVLDNIRERLLRGEVLPVEDRLIFVKETP